MNTLLLNKHTYGKPVYHVQALRHTEVSEAFRQLARLRSSGCLAGYIRLSALLPQEDGQGGFGQDLCGCEQGTCGQGTQPRFLIKFTLFRQEEDQVTEGRKALARVFCPRLVKAKDRELLCSLHEKAGQPAVSEADQDFLWAGFPCDPAAKSFLGRLELDSACTGEAILNMLGDLYPLHAHFQDACEEMLCLGTREVTLPDFDAGQMSGEGQDCQCAAETRAAQALADSFREAFARLVPEPLKEREDALLMGIFREGHGTFFLADPLLERCSTGRNFFLTLGIGSGETEAGKEACGSLDQVFRDFCLPEGLQLACATRLEEGCAFLLAENLARLARLAEEHGISAGAVRAIQRRLARADRNLPLPGALESLGLSPVGCWSALPGEWADLLAQQGVRADSAPMALILRLDTEGRLAVEAHPIQASSPVLGYVRQALDNRNDLLSLDDTALLPCEDSVRTALADGSLHDAIVVNRFAIAAGCVRSDLAFRLGNRVLTPPAEAGAHDTVLRSLLVERGLLQERAVGLAQVIACHEHYCLDCVHGALPVTLVPINRVP